MVRHCFRPLYKLLTTTYWFIDRQSQQEHRLAVGRNAHLRCLHRNWPNHGMGQQGHRNSWRRNWTPGRGLHAQKGTEAQVFVRTK